MVQKNKRIYSDALISESAAYLQVLCNELGADTGLSVFKSITKSISQEFADTVLMQIMSGELNSTSVTLSYPQPGTLSTMVNKVNFIKIVRNYTYIGLKEAVDLYNLINSGVPKKIQFDTKDDAKRFRNELKNIGL